MRLSKSLTIAALVGAVTIDQAEAIQRNNFEFVQLGDDAKPAAKEAAVAEAAADEGAAAAGDAKAAAAEAKAAA